MSRFMAMLVVAVAVCVQAEEYESWKELAKNRKPVLRVTAKFEGKTADVDACLSVAEDYTTPEDYAVYYDGELQLCQLFDVDEIATDVGIDTTSWTTITEASDVTITNDANTLRHTMYVKEVDSTEESSITDAGIVVTIILAIVYGALLLLCGLMCTEEESDISGQMDRLEKRELAKEEAASEEWERRSQAEEAHEKEEAEKELAEVQDEKPAAQ